MPVGIVQWKAKVSAQPVPGRVRACKWLSSQPRDAADPVGKRVRGGDAEPVPESVRDAVRQKNLY